MDECVISDMEYTSLWKHVNKAKKSKLFYYKYYYGNGLDTVTTSSTNNIQFMGQTVEGGRKT